MTSSQYYRFLSSPVSLAAEKTTVTEKAVKEQMDEFYKVHCQNIDQTNVPADELALDFPGPVKAYEAVLKIFKEHEASAKHDYDDDEGVLVCLDFLVQAYKRDLEPMTEKLLYMSKCGHRAGWLRECHLGYIDSRRSIVPMGNEDWKVLKRPTKEALLQLFDNSGPFVDEWESFEAHIQVYNNVRQEGRLHGWDKNDLLKLMELSAIIIPLCRRQFGPRMINKRVVFESK